MKHLLLFCLLLAVSLIANAQQPAVNGSSPQQANWQKMMEDPNVNFFDVQKAFNQAWQGKKIEKGKGWKAFKRWENLMQWRVNPDGSRPAPGNTYHAYEDFVNTSKSPASLAGNWISLGPDDLPGDKGYKGLGRINAIAFHPTDPNIIYVGAPAGGFWYTTTGGNQWITTTDNLPTLGVSAIAVDPSDPSTLYIGTGDRDAGDAPGLGVFKSTDGGLTWAQSTSGLGEKKVGCMLIDPVSPNIVYAGSDNGLYKSENSGSTWSLIQGGNINDMAFKPNNSQVIYAVSAGQFYRSEDAGANWAAISSGLPSGSRAVLAVTAANPNWVYVMLSNPDDSFKGLYKSTNSGLDFTEMSNSPNIMDWSCDGSGSGGQAWYDLALAADKNNPNLIYAGGVDIWKSNTGGAQWIKSSSWYGGCSVAAVHADQHIMRVNPLNGRVYVGNDGGIYWTDNGGTTWHEISTGLVISQSYKIGQSATNSNIVMNGYQDNGTSVFDNGTWTAVMGGDGMDCCIDFEDPYYRYGSVYYGAISRVYGTSNQGTIAANGTNGIDEEGAWVTPFIIDNSSSNTMYIGYKNIWRSTNIKATSASLVDWVKISGMNTPNFDLLEQSPLNPNLIFASSGTKLYRSVNLQDDNPEWIEISNKLPLNKAISAIECSPFDANTLVIAQDKQIFRSTDMGLNWVEITQNLPAIHYNTLAYYKNSLEGLYVGGDAGIYYIDQTLPQWILFMNGMPASASVRDLEIYYDPASPAGDEIKAGTFGRGLWSSDLYFASPQADFTSNLQIVAPGCKVDFADKSSGVPFQWNWTFEGGIPATSTERNPSNVVFNSPGGHTVSLTVTNAAGSDMITRTAYITTSSTVVPTPGFVASSQAFCDLWEVVHFTDTSTNCPANWTWNFFPNTVVYENGTNANSQNPDVRFLNSGSYSVMLSASNVNGGQSLTKNNYIMAGGKVMPYIEDFESQSFSDVGWNITNPDNEMTWALTPVQGSSPGTQAAWMNFFNYSAPPGRRDRLISPPLNLNGLNAPSLSFYHAYADRYSTLSDSLIIFVSNDCGQTWTRVIGYGEKGQGTLATVPKLTTFFAPADQSEWCSGTWGSPCKAVDLSAWKNQVIKIAFESYNRYGNNLYLDNVMVSEPTGLAPASETSNPLVAYPNPADGKVTISGPASNKERVLNIYSSQGKRMSQMNVKAGNTMQLDVDISAFPSGIYMIELLDGKKILHTNLIIR